MKIVSLKIHNILSIQDAEIKFEDSGLVLVEGWNYDDGRANGAGKTAIFNALSFALYGDLPRKINISDIVRKDCKHGFAEAVIKTNDFTLKVKRERPNKVTYYRDDEVLEIGQKEFESYIKLSYDQFIASLYNPQSSGNRFILLNDSGKKDFLLKLMALDSFSAHKKEVDNVLKELNKDLLNKQQRVLSLESKKDAYSESFLDEETLKEEYLKYENSILSIKSLILNLDKIQQPNLSLLDSKENNVLDKLEKVADIKIRRSILMADYNRLVVEDKPFDEEGACSKCGSILDLTEAKNQHERHLLEVRWSLASIKEKLDKLDLVLSKERELKLELSSLRAERRALTEDYDKAMSKKTELNAKLNIQEAKLENIEKAFSSIKELKEKILSLDNEMAIVKKEIEDLVSKVSIYETLSTIYSSNGAPAYVLDFAVESFNESMSNYVSMIWPNARYVLKTYKENAKGDITTKFSEELVIAGKERSIGSLSGGEFRCLSLAVDFAVMDVLSKNFGISLNPIIMDEPFEGLDAAGREIVVELLEKLAIDKCIMIVDHASEVKAMFSKVIKVEKRNGISSIA